MAASRKLVSTLQLLVLLQNRRTASLREVMEHLDVSRVSAARYLQALEDALGVALEVEGDGPDRRYGLPEAHRRAGLVFSQGDALALHFGRQLLGFVEGTALAAWLDELRDKLEIASSPTTAAREARFRRRLVYLTEPFRPYDARDEALGVVLKGLLEDRVLSLDYAGRAGLRRWPRIQPLALVIYRRALYLLARFPRSEAVFRLAVDRIRDASALAETFEYPDGFDPEAELAQTFGIYDDQQPADLVRLRFRPRVADLVLERVWHHTARAWIDDDGSALLEMTASGPELVRLALEWGAAVEVLEPAWLRDQVMHELREALATYDE